MGTTTARVIKNDKVVGYCGHQDTADVLGKRIYDNKEDVWEYESLHGDKTPEPIDDSTLRNLNPIDVIFHTPYGGGSYWPGKADLEKGIIAEGRQMYADYFGRGKPEWLKDGNPLNDEY